DIGMDRGKQDDEGSYLDAAGGAQRAAAYEHQQDDHQSGTVVQLGDVDAGKAGGAAGHALQPGGQRLAMDQQASKGIRVVELQRPDGDEAGQVQGQRAQQYGLGVGQQGGPALLVPDVAQH